jgi:hypothetical protein
MARLLDRLRRSDDSDAPPEPEQQEGDREADAAEALAANGGTDLDAVREILFGEQVAAVARKLSDLDAEFRRQLEVQSDLLRLQIKQEFEALGARLEREIADRRERDGDLVSKIGELNQSLETKIASTQEQVERNQLTLQEQVLSGSTKLNETVQKRYDEMQARLARGLRELDGNKTDRRTLSALIADLASRLHDEEERGGS